MALLLWHHQNVWPGVPRAVAQIVSQATLEAVPSATDTALQEGPDQPTDHVPGEAKRRHVKPQSVWTQQPITAPAVQEAPVVSSAAPVDEAAAERVRGLLEQYDRVQQAMPEDFPPTETLENRDGPPRMDSGDPDPDRLHGPPAHPAPPDRTMADVPGNPALPPVTDPTPRRAPGSDNPAMGQ
jgi:hypothetical protein